MDERAMGPELEEHLDDKNRLEIKTALFAVTDKCEEVVEFARELILKYGVKIIATPGTAKYLDEHGVRVRTISEELLGRSEQAALRKVGLNINREFVFGPRETYSHRVMTLDRNVEAPILADREKKEHMVALKAEGLPVIDLVVCDFYNFSGQTEGIDIGGPTLIRGAAKNSHGVAVVPNKSFYKEVLKNLRENDGRITLKYRELLEVAAFCTTAAYDESIARYLSSAYIGNPLIELVRDDIIPSFDRIEVLLAYVAPSQRIHEEALLIIVGTAAGTNLDRAVAVIDFAFKKAQGMEQRARLLEHAVREAAMRCNVPVLDHLFKRANEFGNEVPGLRAKIREIAFAGAKTGPSGSNFDRERTLAFLKAEVRGSAPRQARPVRR